MHITREGWKLVISDMHEVAISTVRMAIIQTTIEAHSER